MNILKQIVSQIFPRYPKDTKIIITKNAREGMGVWGIREDILRSAVLHGEPVEGKENMFVKRFQNFNVGTITIYDKLKKQYLVLAVWKRR